MWIKSEADRKLYNLALAHTVEVHKRGTKFYVVALFQGSSVNTHAHLGDANVAQLTVGRSEDEAHQILGKITRSLGEDVLNLDTAEARKKGPAAPGAGAPPAINPHVARSLQQAAAGETSKE